jgi:hypothetical protein
MTKHDLISPYAEGEMAQLEADNRLHKVYEAANRDNFLAAPYVFVSDITQLAHACAHLVAMMPMSLLAPLRILVGPALVQRNIAR